MLFMTVPQVSQPQQFNLFVLKESKFFLIYVKFFTSLQYISVQYSTVQYSTVQYSTVQYSTVLYGTVQYSIIFDYCTSRTVYNSQEVTQIKRKMLQISSYHHRNESF